MSVLRSPNMRSDSPQPDLSLRDHDNDSQIAYGKRKQPESECSAEISKLRQEMMSFLKDFSVAQTTNMNKMKEEIMSQLKDQLSGLQITSNKIIAEQNQLKSELKSFKKTTEGDIQALQDSLNYHSGRQDENVQKIQSIASEVTKVNNIGEDIRQLRNKVNDLQFELNTHQQRERLANLEITGLPQKTNEDLRDYLLKISNIAKCQLALEDIISINRVEPRSKLLDKPKVIVAKLRSTLIRDSIISGIRRNRGLTTVDIGLPGEPRQIYVNEHLTPLNKMLFGKAREATKKNGYRYVWVKYGKIFTRKDDTHPPVHIRTIEDISKIK
ncbi:uncharacterized protein LOC114365991 [Ostrinia furnacalis]|uniref:uncharacterized protein LOC114365991 n=1 Tax=Ostrinia furnacalis TaxID=93504 RepID=UPI001038A654|nr:uncharacterized protein LOC114365991 [Ostrinia furnacalis]